MLALEGDNQRMSDYSIIPPSGAYAEDGWFQKFVLQQGARGSLSAGGWTVGNEGFPQQTFLGASIQGFGMQAGFGDTSSTVTVDLVEDEFNTSDGTPYGMGDDPYHNGSGDIFRPPACGTPVFFKFGKNFASVEDAFRKTYDDIYGFSTAVPEVLRRYTMPADGFFDLPPYHYVDLDLSDNNQYVVEDQSPYWNPATIWRGVDHLAFGGILQSYVENTNATGGITLMAQLVDPREILSNCTIVLNNYQGTTFNNKNLFNVYGFLEYDPSEKTQKMLEGKSDDKHVLKKNISDDGLIFYTGDDTYEFPSDDGLTSSVSIPDRDTNFPAFFPITGQGFSRRSGQGMPFYRVAQALTAMWEYFGGMPEEYIDAGFGGKINFRGYNYIVDFRGIPTQNIPQMYFMDFDQLDLMSFAQELCDVISHELFVSLLPIIDHPACSAVEKFNNQMIKEKFEINNELD